MIKVYFETKNHNYADIVATFQDEETYMACLPILKKQAKKLGMIITESTNN